MSADPVEVERGTSGSAPLLGNTSCHGLCQFSSIQSLSALSVYTGCLQLLSQCGTGTRQGGFILCGLTLLPCSQVHFFYLIKMKQYMRFREIHIVSRKNFKQTPTQQLCRCIANVPNVNTWMFWMVKWISGLLPWSVNQMCWYSPKQENCFVLFISWKKTIVVFGNKSSLIWPNQAIK